MGGQGAGIRGAGAVQELSRLYGGQHDPALAGAGAAGGAAAGPVAASLGSG